MRRRLKSITNNTSSGNRQDCAGTDGSGNYDPAPAGCADGSYFTDAGIILKPVHRNLALISAFVGVVSMITFAIAQSHFWASSIILKDAGGMTAFTEEQRIALAYLSLRIATMIASLFMCFYGTASAIRGFLIMRSGYLPKVLGVLLMIGGGGFILRSVTYVLAPAYGSTLMLMPMAVAGIPLTFWLLVKGVDRAALEGR